MITYKELLQYTVMFSALLLKPFDNNGILLFIFSIVSLFVTGVAFYNMKLSKKIQNLYSVENSFFQLNSNSENSGIKAKAILFINSFREINNSSETILTDIFKALN